MNVYCTECKKEKDEKLFYKRFINDNRSEIKLHEKVIATVSTNRYGICKECLIEKFTKIYKLFNEDFEKTLKAMCEDYNLPFVTSLISSHTDMIFIERLNYYIKDITSLKQYYDMNYSDSIGVKEKSDIDFINEDIKQLKKNIEKAIQKEDFNAHNKWMNCLRDAIELRERLQGESLYTINVGTVNVSSTNAEDFINELTKLAENRLKLS